MGYSNPEQYRMIEADLRECEWLGELKTKNEMKIRECADLQRYIIKLAKDFGANFDEYEVLDEIDRQERIAIEEFYEEA